MGKVVAVKTAQEQPGARVNTRQIREAQPDNTGQEQVPTGPALDNGEITRPESAQEEQRRRRAERRPVPTIIATMREGSNQTVLDIKSSDKKEDLAALQLALGVTNDEFANELLTQVLNVHGVDRVNYAVASIAAIEPRDEVEAMLAAQMTAVHATTMRMAALLNEAKNFSAIDNAEKALNKLTRTYTAQVEALSRYRGKGQQKVTVEHVHVYEGGQAVVGNVAPGGSGKGKG